MNLNTFDPRTRILFYGCMSLAIVIAQNLWWLSGLVLLGLLCLWFARISWSRIRPVLPPLLILAAFVTATNWFFRTPLEAAQQVLRMLAMVGFSFGILFSIDPSDIGIAFRQLGLPDRFAYTLDLTARFVPTLVRDFRTTIDAQKARGYELEARDRSLKSILNAGRRVIPLFVPVIVRAVLDAEDTTNAMDLRAFGTQPRTWLRQLRFRGLDYIAMALSLASLAAVIAFRWMGW